jgi:hypothetical protein
VVDTPKIDESPSEDLALQSAGPTGRADVRVEGNVAPTSRRQAFRDVRRQLSDDDLASPGVQKLILDELERAEAECDQLRGYIDRYHEAEKRAAILNERLKPIRSIDLLFGVGVGLGGAILGLAPVFWTEKLQAVICLIVGALLILGSVAGRLVKG